MIILKTTNRNIIFLFPCILHLKREGGVHSVMVIAIENELNDLIGWLVGFYGILTFVGYLMPNPFLYK